MHELSATQNILHIVMDHAERNHADSVSAINLVVGDFANIVPDCVGYYWKIITEGTIYADAVLRFDRRPAIFECDDCGSHFEITREMTACPQCGSDHVTFISGDELLVESIEIVRNEKEK